MALCWLIVSLSVAGWLPRTSPTSALLPRGNDPASLLAPSTRKSTSAPAIRARRLGLRNATARRLTQLRDLAETALVNEPLSSRAYRLLGQIADRQGAAEKAETLMRAAARADLHESAAVHWMMWKSFERKDYPAAAYYADALLRSGDKWRCDADSARMAEDPAAKQEIKTCSPRSELEERVSWRARPVIRDARTPLELFLSLKEHASAANDGRAQRLSVVSRSSTS